MATSSASSDASSKFSTRVSAAELRAWAPFVRKDAIRAGDVVLSRGRGAGSSVIARMTGGRYSHAAIFLPFRFEDQRVPLKIDQPDADAGPVDFDEAMRKYGSILLKRGVHLDLVEADDYGVGATPPRALTIKFGARRYDVIRLAGDPPPKAAVLLRHPKIASVDERRIEEEVRTFSDAELLRSYSSMDRLANPLTLPKPIKSLLGRFLLWKYPQNKRVILPSCFCSELVVKFFGRLGIPLFTGTVASENISPNHLAPPRSFLQPVPEAIITAADIPADAHGDFILDQKDLRAHYLISLVDLEAHTKVLFPQIKKEIEDTSALVNKVAEIIRIGQLNKDIIHDAGGAVVQGQILDTVSDESIAPTLRYKLDELLLSTIRLKFLRDHLRSATLPTGADSILSLLHDRQEAELYYRHERTKALVRMSRARRLPAEESRRERMSALAAWRSEKARWGQQRAVLDRSIPRGPSDARTQALVTKALAEVTAKTKAAIGLS